MFPEVALKKKRSFQLQVFKDLFFIDLEPLNIKARPWFEPSANTRRSNATLQRSGLLYFTAVRPSELVQRSLLHTHICTYVYWTVHHLDSWIKIDQLDVTCFLFHYLMLNMFRMLIHPSSGACDLYDELFHGLYCSGTMCVGVTVWFGWGGMVSLCRLKQCFMK